MDVNCAVVDFGVLAPYAVEQLRAREYAARLFHQKFQQAEQRRTKMDVTLATPHSAGFAIEVEIAGVKAVGDAFGTAAAQQRVDTGHQLWNQEGFDDVIVRADGKAAYALRIFAARGYHDDRERARILARPKPSADFNARYPGHHPVEDDEVVRAFGEGELGIVTPLHALDDIIAGLIGNQSPFKNIAPTMVWVIGWVGLSFASALIGDIWTVLNPWDSVARFVAQRRQRGNPPRSNSDLRLSMRWLDAWLGVVIFLLFAWCELIWDGSDEPRSLALALLGYSALTWAGMFLFGRPQWLQRGEIFSVAFGLFSRFAPLETVDEGKGAPMVLRPYAAGLLSREPKSPALTCFVLLLLATVTFDGILETPAWAALAAWFEPRGLNSATLATLGLVGLPLAYIGIYLVTIGLTLGSYAPRRVSANSQAGSSQPSSQSPSLIT